MKMLLLADVTLQYHFFSTKTYNMKQSTRLSPATWLWSLSLILFGIISCKKEISEADKEPKSSSEFSFSNSQAKEESKKIHVADIGQLYAAINDAANARSTIVLAAGTYVLNAGYPNAGRLELLENMQLQGQTGHPGQVIIDASALPGTSFVPPNNFPAPRTGAIRMGRGSNAIEWLTVKGNASTQAFSVIDTDLIWTGVSQVKVAHCVVSGGRSGIDVRNVGVASIGRVLEAELSNNEVLENFVQQGVGILIQNANSASGAIIRAKLIGNYVHGNKIGLRSYNVAGGINTINSASTSIESNADRFEENGLGIALVPGISEGPTATANGNFVNFEGHGTTIKNSIGAIPPETFNPSCGIVVMGGFRFSTGEASNNRVTMNLWGCTFSNNQGAADIYGYGAYSEIANPAGIHNLVQIQLNGVSKKATVIAIGSLPAEPAGTNVVNIIR
jgi:hypothetical protein